jgi:entericidin A
MILRRIAASAGPIRSRRQAPATRSRKKSSGPSWLPHDGAAVEFPPRHKDIAMKRFLITAALLAFSVTALTACNTVAGAGKDVQKAGEKVEDAAK